MQTVSFHPKLFIGYSELADGNIDKRFSSPEEYKTNRKNLYKHFNFNQHQLVEGQQVHADRILRLDSENTKMWRGQLITGVDGFVTDQHDVYLVIRVADCTPLVIFDPVHRAVAVIHAGFPGTVKQIHLNGLDRLVKSYASRPGDLLVWVGPCANRGSYLRAEEPAIAHDPAWKPYLHKHQNQWLIDFPQYIVDTLKTAGIFKKNMTIDTHCTVTDTRLFSHQRAKTTHEPEGRFAVVVKLR